MRTASPVEAELARIVTGADHAMGLCEELVRSLPEAGEPPLRWQLRAELGGSDDLRVDDASRLGKGPWLVYLHSLQDPKRFSSEVAKPAASAVRRGDRSLAGRRPSADRAGSAARTRHPARRDGDHPRRRQPGAP
jgi:hypothetical protein